MVHAARHDHEKEKKPNNNVSVLFQVVLISFTLFCLYQLLNYRLSIYLPLDPYPEVRTVTPAVQKKLVGRPDIVKVGLYIREFQKFDMVKNEFVFSAFLMFLYKPEIIDAERLGKFVVTNGELIAKSDPTITIHGDRLLARFGVRIRVAGAFVYRHFPLEDHRIFVVLTNNEVSIQDVLFSSEAQDFQAIADVSKLGWTQLGLSSYTGFAETKIFDSNKSTNIYSPRAVFTLNYSRTSPRYTLLILLPILLIFFLASFSFSIETDKGIALSIGAITATLAYRFVIENLSPTVGYFTISDYIFFLLLILNGVLFAAHFIGNLNRLNKKLLLIAMHLTIISVFYYLVIYW